MTGRKSIWAAQNSRIFECGRSKAPIWPATPSFRPIVFQTTRLSRLVFFGAFFTDYECSETDLEELMWRTLELIFDRGIGPKMAHDECTRIITDISARNDFETLVRDMPEREAVEIRTDLQLLGFL